MLKIIGRILIWIRGETLRLLLLAGILLLIWGIFSPVGTLVWWLNQSAEELGVRPLQAPRSLPHTIASSSSSGSRSATKINCYILFLPGVGDFSANRLTPGEEFFLDRLVELHPNCVTVADVFPYSAANQSLGAQERFLDPFWRAINSSDGWLNSFGVLIKIRNLWRFAISADDRYGTVYNQGIATAIIERMNAVQPLSSDRNPPKLILLGTSGGVQVSLGAAYYLKQWLNSELVVVSVGGVFDGSAGFDQVEHVYHLQGDRDWVEDIGRIIFASRWYWVAGSPFNRARQQKRYTVLNSGPHTHDGDQGYFGEASVNESQTTYVELTVHQVNQLPIWSAQSP